ncbi:LysR family transcriptional regulator [Proteocatella sphenisci]|uniref:LysR family transcriptional regulator n=1 Tax=Proteocatella sphenisci TaxID=181070 RepID=UPI00048C5762|nr:LysR family transcriptional regulator [Proteocatella sphenisci]
MVDNRVHTFLKLCEMMNYRKTAEELNMSQPAVTQQIHFLEREYGCKLFEYSGRVLSKTQKCKELEIYARSVVYNDNLIRRNIEKPFIRKISIGATKTIGDYIIEDKVIDLLKLDNIELEIIIDNTEYLLKKLNALELDILLIEGSFDKDSYGFELIKQEELIGICSLEHCFAQGTVSLADLLKEHIIIRESGSGTRGVFENFLKQNSYSFNSFARKSVISSFKLTEKAVSENCGVSFVYESIARNNKNLSTFKIENTEILHEYNYVFLKSTCVDDLLNLF